MSRVDLSGIEYIGGDIVEPLIHANRERFESPARRFLKVDIISGPLPEADVILCRDCLVHFSFANIAATFRTVKASGAEYFLTTTFPGRAGTRISSMETGARSIWKHRPFCFQHRST